MALTTTTVPTSFQPVAGNALIYAFNESALGGKTNYRVEITVWDEPTGLQISTIPTLSYSCDYSTGNIVADISAAVRTVLKFDKLGSALPAGQKLFNHFRRLFIKYEGVYNEGSTGVVSLSASVVVPFNGTRHVGTDLLGTFPVEYVVNDDGTGTGLALWPTRGSATVGKITTWTGFRTFIDFLMNTTAAKFNRLQLTIFDQGSSGAAADTYTMASWRPPRETSRFIWGVDFNLPTSLGPVAGSLSYYLDLTSVTDWGETQTNTRRTDFGFGTIYGQTFTPAATGSTHYLTLYKVERVGSPTYSINFQIWSTAAGLPNTLLATFNKKILHHPSGADLTLKIDGITLNAATQYALVISPVNDGVGDVGNHIRFFSSGASFFAGGTEIQKIGAGAWTTNAGDVNGMDTLFTTHSRALNEVEIRDSNKMQNVVQLTWLTDIGGRVSWGFEYSQDSGYKIEADRRAKNVRLFAPMVTALEWHMINELNKSGFRYSDYKKLGQRVLDLTQVSAYQDVFVVPTMDRYKTKQIRPSTEVTIEYPELPPNQITQ